MKYSEINLEKQNYNMSCNTYAIGEHYKSVMALGRVLPTTKAQVKAFINISTPISVLNSKDALAIEKLLNKHQMYGTYKFTKSKNWVRLQNNEDLIVALKNEYLQ